MSLYYLQYDKAKVCTRAETNSLKLRRFVQIRYITYLSKASLQLVALVV